MFWTSHNSIEKTRKWILFELEQIKRDDWYRFAVVLKNSGVLIGTVLIYREASSWEIAYNFGKSYCGKGYATEAARAVVDLAVNRLHISEIRGRYAVENHNSGNVLKKLGFKYEKDIPYECNNGAVMRRGIQCKPIVEYNAVSSELKPQVRTIQSS